MMLLRAVPDDEWVSTERMLTLARAAGLDVRDDGGGPMLGHRKFVELLRDLRRRGCVVFRRHESPPVWCRTPKGTRAS